MSLVWSIFEYWREDNEVPDHVAVLLRDLITFRKRNVPISDTNGNNEPRKVSGYINILYHNKGIDMVNLPRILNSRYVRDIVPGFVQNVTPTTVSFKYQRQLLVEYFNQKKVVEDLDINVRSSNVCCDCHTSKYCYDHVGM